MAALSESAAGLGKRSEVLAGEAATRVTRQSRAEPPVRDHRRGGGLRDKRWQVPGRDRSNATDERADRQQAHDEKLPTLRRIRFPRLKHPIKFPCSLTHVALQS